MRLLTILLCLILPAYLVASGPPCECGDHCPCRTCGCETKAAVIAPVAADAVLARTVRTPFLNAWTGEVAYYRDWSVREYLAAGGTVAGLVGLTEPERAALRGYTPRTVVASQAPTPAPVPAYQPAYYQAPRFVGLSVQGPYGGSFSAGYCAGVT